MVFKIQLTLSESEAAGLVDLATREIRSPQEQLRYLLRRELTGLGLLPPELGSCSARDTLPLTEE